MLGRGKWRACDIIVTWQFFNEKIHTQKSKRQKLSLNSFFKQLENSLLCKKLNFVAFILTEIILPAKFVIKNFPRQKFTIYSLENLTGAFCPVIDK